MNTMKNQQLLQAIALFAFAHKGNTDDIDFESTDAGIELENLAFFTAESMNFNIEEHLPYLSKATVVERCSLMIKQLVALVAPELEHQHRLYIAILDCPEFNTPEYLFNHEERLEELNIVLWTCSDLSNLPILEPNQISTITALNLLDGIITNEQQSFSVFRVK
ncbi:hypothetical protein [Vibrio crassostreae]|uniref:hypothetical protein n=2 Tax=Vibrio crassostreae TaxID=246167 RepID=UPI00063406BC|nr:hypothetical protein [Vibrio crassostreae]CDT26505.1 hypothetical protein VCRLGP107_390019 [Vibrio crassostreae]